MMTLAICASKGGVGKTTLAAALAIAATEDGLYVGLIDTDPQQSLARWMELRGDCDNPRLVTNVKELPDAIGKMEVHSFDLAIIDTPPALMSRLEPAIAVADFVLVPVQPSPLDVEAIDPVIELAGDHRKSFAFVLNRVEPRDAMTKGTEDYLRAAGEVLEQAVGNRRAFRGAMAYGKSGPEMEGGKAREEITALWAAVKKRMRKSARKVA
jgi:chromosome partitioning protein